jgi:hypothetical protein
MNNILQDQVKPLNIDRLAAQRQLYSDAKKILVCQIIITIPAVIIWSFAVMFISNLEVFAAFWAIIAIFLYYFVLRPSKNSLRTKAAQIQELFDCDVLQLQWPSIKAGQKPDQETITKYAHLYKKKNPQCSDIKNWYPTCIKELPIHLARIVCQRCNCTWDADLRRQYARWITVILLLIILSGVLISIFAELTVEQLILAIISPLIPAFIFCYSQISENIKTAKQLDNIKTHFIDLWNNILNNRISAEESNNQSRILQDEIYEHRKSCSPIFDWIYRRLKKKSEEYMDKNAEALIQQAHNRNLF